MSNEPISNEPPAEHRRGGRPTSYTPEVVQRILQNIVDGIPLRGAAKYAGITYETFRDWRNNNPAFSALVNTALEERAQTLLKRADDLSKTDGRTLFRLLELSDPEVFTPPPIQVDHHHSGQVEHTHKLSNPYQGNDFERMIAYLQRPELPAEAEQPAIEADFEEL
jgi:hypothetical protein